MSRYAFDLNTAKRTYTVTDLQMKGRLTFKQDCSEHYFENISEGDTDRLVEFANDFQQDLAEGRIALRLDHENTITFNDNDFPILEGGIRFKNTHLKSGNIVNANLNDVEIRNSKNIVISNCTVEDLHVEMEESVNLSHCYINDAYPEIRNNLSAKRNEWFMGKDVTGTMW